MYESTKKPGSGMTPPGKATTVNQTRGDEYFPEADTTTTTDHSTRSLRFTRVVLPAGNWANKSYADREWTWAQFVRFASKPPKVSPPKAQTKAAFDRAKASRGGFIGGEATGHRADQVKSRSMLVLDCDDSPTDIIEALRHLGVAALAWTTYKSNFHDHDGKPTGDRWRVVLPLSRDVSTAEYRDLARRFISAWGCDPSCDQPNRVMFWPVVPDAAHADSWQPVEFTGGFLDPDNVPDLTATPVPAEAAEPRYAAMTVAGHAELMRTCPEGGGPRGGRNNLLNFLAGIEFNRGDDPEAELAEAALEAGMSQGDVDRCLRSARRHATEAQAAAIDAAFSDIVAGIDVPDDDLSLFEGLDVGTLAELGIWQESRLKIGNAARDLGPIEQVSWLAKGWIPRAKVVYLVGEEGIGKSLFWEYLAAAVSSGSALPEINLPKRSPGRILVILSEDDWRTTVAPRLIVAGADLTRIEYIAIDLKSGSGTPEFPGDLAILENVAANYDLIVLDAFFDTFGSKDGKRLDANKGQDARAVMIPLQGIATRTGVAVLALTHTNRQSTRAAREKYATTSELRKAARQTIFALNDDGTMAIGVEKSNLTKPGNALRFERESVHVPGWVVSEDTEDKQPRLKLCGRYDKPIGEVLEARFDAEAELKRSGVGQDAASWLFDYLAEHGETLKSEVLDAAPYGDTTMKRALKKIGGLSEVKGFPAKAYWSLAKDEPLIGGPTGEA